MPSKKYSFLKPTPGYAIVKQVQDDDCPLVRTGIRENNTYATIVALHENSELKVGDVYVYKDMEGDELYQWGKVKEDDLILIEEKHLLCQILTN